MGDLTELSRKIDRIKFDLSLDTCQGISISIRNKVIG